jgi:hypothetical protein
VSENEPTEQVPEQSTPSEPEARQPSLGAVLIKKLWWKIHTKFPNVIPSPYGDDRAYHREADEEENAHTRVPIEAELRLNAVWAAELFGPAEIESLYSSLQRLGWDEARVGMPDHHPSGWIKHHRMYGSEGYFNVGLVARAEDRQRLFHRDYFAQLPKEVEYLLVNLWQVTSSITCVFVGFVFKEEHARCYEEQLLKDRKTVHRTYKGRSGYSTFGVEHLKREAIESARARYRNVAVQWIQKHIPGHFCLRGNGQRMPTTELITSISENILKSRNEASEPRDKWAELLIPYSWEDTWINHACNGFRLRFDDLSADAPFHAITTLRTADLPDETLEFRGGRSRGAFVAFSHERLARILTNYAALALLREISRDLKHSRESLKTARASHRAVLKSLEQIKTFFDQSLGVPAMAAELKKRSDNPAGYAWRCENFQDESIGNGEEPQGISEALRLQMKHLSERVLADEETTREHFQQIATILSTRESVKAQNRMERLTVVTVILALGSLLAALPRPWLKAVQSYVLTHLFG